MTILSIDPGGTTGIAFVFGNDIESPSFETQTCTTKEQVWDLVLRDDVREVVIERFATSDYLSRYGLLTIEIVGGVKALCYALQKKLIIHQPQNRYSMQGVAKELLKQKGEKFVIHQEDALAHMLYYLQTGK